MLVLAMVNFVSAIVIDVGVESMVVRTTAAVLHPQRYVRIPNHYTTPSMQYATKNYYYEFVAFIETFTDLRMLRTCLLYSGILAEQG